MTSRASKLILSLSTCTLLALSAAGVLAQTRSTLPTSRSSQGEMRAQPTVAPLAVPVASSHRKPLPPWPARPAGKGTRNVLSASGGSVTVATVSGCTEAAGSDIYPTGCAVTIEGANLTGTTATYQDYVQVPNGTVAVATLGGTYVGNNDTTRALTLSSPGVYIVGALNVTSNRWDAVIYIAVGTPIAFDTYADSGLTTPSQTLAANGSNVIYFSASGLTPTDKYVYTVENTSDNGACVFTAPAQASYTTTDLLCNPEAPGLSGTSPSPTNGTFNAQWQPTFGTPTALQPGAYSVSIYDQTIHQRISQRQISLTSATGGAPTSLVTFYPNGNLFAGVAGETTPRIAFNGGANQSAYDSALNYVSVYNGGSGLTAGKSYKFTVADPQGNVVFSQNNTAAAGGTVPGGYNVYGLPTNAVYIPLATIAAGNVYTSSIYDIVAGKTVASQAWQVLNYSTQPTFNNGSSQLPATATPGGTTDASITFLNDGITRFGASNSDRINKITVTTNTNFPGLACTTACPTTVTDSDHQVWNVTLTGGGAAAYVLTMTAPTGTGLKPGSTVVMPLTITTGATSKCPSATPCTMTVQITPLHNGILSGTGNTYITGQLQVTDNGSDHSGNIFADIVDNNATNKVLQLLPGYTPYTNYHVTLESGIFPYANFFGNNAYAAGQPFTSPPGYNLYVVDVGNTSSNTNASFTEIGITLPAGIAASKVLNAGNFTVNGVPQVSPNITVTNCGGQNGLPANTFCISNFGSIAAGGSTYFFLFFPQSTVAFPYAPIGGTIVNSDAGFGKLITLVSDGTRDVFVPATSGGNGIAANEVAAYSLNASEMLSTVTPSSLGTNVTNNVTLSFENTPYSSDPFPDYVDGVLVEVPTPGAGQPVSAIAVQQNNISPAGWSFLNGGSSFVYGGHTYYWFGLCSNQYDTSYTLPDSISGTTHGGDAPSADDCVQTPTEQEALQPGQTLSVPLKVVTTGTAGTFTGYIFAHGANGNGWSSGTAFTFNVATGTSASGGFSGLSTYNAANSTAALTPGQQPAIGGDSNTTYGNSYSYTVTNTGNNAVGKIDIQIPGETSTGAAGADSSGVYPTLTGGAAAASVAFTGGNGSGGCTITNFTSSSSQTTDNGYIELGGSSCTLNPGDSVTVNFSMKMPYRVNVVYAFPTTVYAKSAPTTAVAATETWVNDSTLTITNSAVLSVTANAAAVCAGGTGQSVNTALNLLNFGAINPSSTETCTQAVTASVWTPVSSPYGWSLYASIDSNPARSGAGATNEALMRFSAAGSTLQDANVAGGSTTFTVIPSSPGSGGFLVGQTTGGGTATSYRTPFVFAADLEISIGTETVTTQQHTMTYTWVSN